jgi:hypothetical protein
MRWALALGTIDDAEMYQQFVDAAIKGHVNLGL